MSKHAEVDDTRLWWRGVNRYTMSKESDADDVVDTGPWWRGVPRYTVSKTTNAINTGPYTGFGAAGEERGIRVVKQVHERNHR